MEIFGQFGVEPVLLAAQVVNFLVLAFIFKKFLYKPILKVLNERQKKIEKGLKDAEDAEKQRVLANEEKEKILTAASKEAEKIIDDTKKAAEKIKDDILTGARNDADKIIKSANNQANAQMDEMEKRAKKASLDNSVAILEKVLEGMFSKDERKKILDRNIKVLSSHDKS